MQYGGSEDAFALIVRIDYWMRLFLIYVYDCVWKTCFITTNISIRRASSFEAFIEIQLFHSEVCVYSPEERPIKIYLSACLTASLALNCQAFPHLHFIHIDRPSAIQITHKARCMIYYVTCCRNKNYICSIDFKCRISCLTPKCLRAIVCEAIAWPYHKVPLTEHIVTNQ